MGTKTLKSQFNGGEVSPEFFGMIGDAKYQSGAAKLRNFIALPHGPASNRAGTEFILETKDSTKPSRLIPFNFGMSQAFAIEVGEGYFRFHTDGGTLEYATPATWSNATAYTVGDLVLRTGVNYYAIQNGTNKDPTTETAYWYALPSSGVYEIPNAFTDDDLFNIKYEQNADVLTMACEGRATVELRRYGNTRWILTEIDFGAPIDAPGAPTVTANGYSGSGGLVYSYVVTSVIDGDGESVASTAGTATNNLNTSGAYNAISWPSVTGADRYNIYKLTGGIYGYIGSTTGTSINDDNIAPDIGYTPPLYEDPFTKTGAITAVAVTNGGTNYPNTFTGGGFVGVACNPRRTGRINNVDFPPIGEIEGKNHPTLVVFDETGSGATFTFNRLASKYSHDANGKLHVTLPVFDITTAGSGYTSPIFVLTDTKSGRVIESYFDYSLSPIVQNVTISVTDATGFGADLVPVISGGIVQSITVKNPGRGYSATPTITLTDATSTGSGFVVGAITVDDDGDYPNCVSYFEQRKVFAGTENNPQNFWATKTGSETALSYHIPIMEDDRISRRIASRQLNKILHIVPLQDMILLTNSAEWRITSENSDAITPKSISAKPQSYIGSSNVRPVVIGDTVIFCAAKGGHIRELGYSSDRGGYATGDLSLRASHLFDDSTIVDMCMTRTPFPIVWAVNDDGLLIGLTYVPEQQVYAWHWHDTFNGAFESCCAVDDDEADSMYVIVRREINGGIKRYVERLVRRKFFALQDSFFVDCGLTYDGASTTTISGLDHLEGMTVSILADGAVVSPREVVSGSITLDVAASLVHVGLPIVADIQTLPVALGVEAYAQARMKNVSAVWVRINESSGLWAGPDDINLIEAKQRTTEPYDSPPGLMSREVKIVTKAKWNDSGQVFIRQEDPLPLTVVSVTMEVTMGD